MAASILQSSFGFILHFSTKKKSPVNCCVLFLVKRQGRLVQLWHYMLLIVSMKYFNLKSTVSVKKCLSSSVLKN